MTTPVIPLPSAKAMTQAAKWLATKRTDTTQSRQRRAELMEALIGGLSQSLGDLGIEKVVMGDHVVVDISEPTPRTPTENARWSDHLAQGGQVVILEINNANCGYLDQERVDPSDRQLDELIDIQQVQALAPTATLYGPQDTNPWSDRLSKRGFQIWVTNSDELLALWQHIPQWLKTQWHDQTMAPTRYPRTAHEVFKIFLTRLATPDLNWRIAQAERALAASRTAQDMGYADATAQASLKTALGALAAVESHPILGLSATQAIDELLPLLAYAMEGKAKIQKLNKAAQDAELKVYSAIERACVSLGDWSPHSLPTW